MHMALKKVVPAGLARPQLRTWAAHIHGDAHGGVVVRRRQTVEVRTQPGGAHAVLPCNAMSRNTGWLVQRSVCQYYTPKSETERPPLSADVRQGRFSVSLHPPKFSNVHRCSFSWRSVWRSIWLSC